ncbi:MAG: hypothetical protein IPK15_18700 [Verrucomicrobia bacterium]|nr:hypothetical protein [Verrucomicrobiota bacterium]
MNASGEIHPVKNSDDGVTLIETLGLDAEDYNELRQLLLGLRADLAIDSESYRCLLGYPKELPNLLEELPPPRGNKDRMESESLITSEPSAKSYLLTIDRQYQLHVPIGFDSPSG